jgi:hypothetical protein
MKAVDQRNIALKNRIMRRVYIVWGVRALLHPVFLKALIVFVFFSRSTSYISYANVWRNAPELTDLPRNLAFMRDAFVHTDAISATLILGMLMLMTWIAFDLVHRPRHAQY